MSHLVLVRHGRAAAGFADDLDPGLDDLGRQQAEAMADALALFGPMPLYSSPLRRCQETAAALADRWGVEVMVEKGVGEVESPTPDLASRGAWLRGFMSGTWEQQPPELQAWRQLVIDTVLELGKQDGVVVTHFVAINVVVGYATGNPRVVSFSPDNCSRTEIKVEGSRIEVVELGGQARTTVR